MIVMAVAVISITFSGADAVQNNSVQEEAAASEEAELQEEAAAQDKDKMHKTEIMWYYIIVRVEILPITQATG